MIKGIEAYKADRRPYVQMMIKKYQAHRYDHKFFLFGLILGFVPYIIHMKF